MKKFIKKGAFLILILLVIVGVVDCGTFVPSFAEKTSALFGTEEYLEENSGLGMHEIRKYIEGVKKEDDTNVLIVGDSIARQLFSLLPDQVDNISIQCANAAINITGQYMLVSEYLESHEEVTDIWLIMHPITLTRTFDTELGYSYAVAPFAEYHMLRYLDKDTLDDMASVYGRFFTSNVGLEFIKGSPLNRKLYLAWLEVYGREYKQETTFEIADKYLMNMYKLCEERGVQLHFLASPSTEYYRDNIQSLEEDYQNTEISKLYPQYLDDIYYFPTEWTEDSTHLAGEYMSEENYRNILQNIIKEETIGGLYDQRQ